MVNRPVNYFLFMLYGIFCIFKKNYSLIINGKPCSIKISTANELHRAVTFYSKEPETLRWIDGFNKLISVDRPVFFDVGANIGIYSIYAATLHQNIKVFSFEPESQSFSSLCSNLSQNKLPLAAPYQFAISNKVGMGELKVSSMTAGAGAAALNENYRFMRVDANNIFTQGIFFTSLDYLVYECGFPVPNFIKIDVDGIEVDILHGAKQVLAEAALRSVLVEFQYKDESDLLGIFEFLQSFGLSLCEKSEWISGVSGLSSRNFIFQKN